MKTRYYPIVFVLLSVVIFCGCQKPDPSVTMQPIIDQYLKFWNTGDFENIENIMHEDFVLRTTPKYEAVEGLEAFKEYVQYFRTGYPDFTVVIDEVMYDEGRATMLWTVDATHTGESDIPTTGKHVTIQGISFHHFKDGKMLDVWIAQNDQYFLEQIGFQMMPPAPPAVEEK